MLGYTPIFLFTSTKAASPTPLKIFFLSESDVVLLIEGYLEKSEGASGWFIFGGWPWLLVVSCSFSIPWLLFVRTLKEVNDSGSLSSWTMACNILSWAEADRLSDEQAEFVKNILARWKIREVGGVRYWPNLDRIMAWDVHLNSDVTNFKSVMITQKGCLLQNMSAFDDFQCFMFWAPQPGAANT